VENARANRVFMCFAQRFFGSSETEMPIASLYNKMHVRCGQERNKEMVTVEDMMEGESRKERNGHGETILATRRLETRKVNSPWRG